MVTTAQAQTSPGADADALLAALVERARGGDMQAWARLYQDHWARLLRHVAYLTGDVATAEDLVQETFAQALASLARHDARPVLRVAARRRAQRRSQALAHARPPYPGLHQDRGAERRLSPRRGRSRGRTPVQITGADTAGSARGSARPPARGLRPV